MNKKEYQYKMLKLFAAPICDEFLGHMLYELLSNWKTELLEEINEKIIETKLGSQRKEHD